MQPTTSPLGSAWTIRPSVPEDAPALRSCLDVVARERRYIAMLEGPSLEQLRTYLELLSTRGGIQQVAATADAIIGWCDLTPKFMAGFRHTATLGMGVLPAHRGHGIGRALLRAVLQRAAEGGQLNRIELEVYTSNVAAVALYERFGFLREGIKRRARVIDGHTDDILCMALLTESHGHDAV
ncbi:MAG: N-acetyltransferase family protein [Vicinamibacterales bacterium]